MSCFDFYCSLSRLSSIVQLSTNRHLRKMENIKVKFGQRVKELRLSKGYSQEKLAEISDLDRTYIPGIEAGKRNVSLVFVEKKPNCLNKIQINNLFFLE